jgi:hypothetical protein
MFPPLRRQANGEKKKDFSYNAVFFFYKNCACVTLSYMNSEYDFLKCILF